MCKTIVPRPGIKKFLIFAFEVLAILILLLVGVVAFLLIRPTTISVGGLRGATDGQLTGLLGREVEIDGDIVLLSGTLPSTRVGDVSIGNPDSCKLESVTDPIPYLGGILLGGEVTREGFGRFTQPALAGHLGEFPVEAAIDLVLTPSPKRAQRLSLEVPIGIGGTLREVEIGMGGLPLATTTARMAKNTLMFPVKRVVGEELPEAGSIFARK